MVTVSKLLLLLFCSYCSLVAHAGDSPSYITGSVKTEAVCSEPKATPSTSVGATVTLHHRHGPCSLTQTNQTLTVEEILLRDQLRARNIQRKFVAAANATGHAQKLEATLPTTLGTAFDTSEYVINVSIGMPPVMQTVMIDTGSDTSWVHCKPCSPCHAQVDPVFDPSKSSTYSPFPCSSAACTQLKNDGGAANCSSSQCQYIVRYMDGSNTTGTYSSDTLTLGPNVIPGFRFGCSRIGSGFEVEKIAGLIGLGGGAQSLVSQTAAKFGPDFSYCLPTPRTSSGFLTLGAPSGGGGGNFTTTKMFRLRQVPTFYLVLLVEIRVGGTRVDVSPTVFSGGSVMDSGTVITYLPPRAYSAMRSAFRAVMLQLKYQLAKPRGSLDTCYDFSNLTTVLLPAVELVFDGAAVVHLDVNGIMFGSCLAFAPSDDGSLPGIIGNVQQRTFEVLHDVSQGTIGFRAGAC